MRHIRKIKRRDFIARWVITAGGLAIIASVAGICVLTVAVALPLFGRPALRAVSEITPAGDDAAALVGFGADEYLETLYTIDARGTVSFYEAKSRQLLEQMQAERPGPDASIVRATTRGNAHGLLWDTGAATLLRVSFTATYAPDGRRVLTRALQHETPVEAPEGALPGTGCVWPTTGENGGLVRVDTMTDGRLAVTREAVETDIFGGTSRATATGLVPTAGQPTAMALDSTGNVLYVATQAGQLERWSVADAAAPELLERFRPFADGRRVTAMTLVLGDVSLAMGDERGEVTVWMPVSGGHDGKKLVRAHNLPPHGAAVAGLAASPRNRNLVSMDEAGSLHVVHVTNERLLVALSGEEDLAAACMGVRGDTLLALDGTGRLAAWRLDAPHPEMSMQALFGKIWYEGYDDPAYVWQSSASTHDVEPKLSLMPLVFGSLKGTFYAMLFAAPLALLAAVYTSQFTTPRFRGIIKPAVEVMAAIPSVVLGFLAALWLAPFLEDYLVSFFIALAAIPAALGVFLGAWSWVRHHEWAKRVERGYEFLVLGPVLMLAVLAAWQLQGPVEAWLFGGDFQGWLYREAGQRYDQRNCIIIAFGLGFAVLPIIFTIADDALSNVPHSLKAASLALGASRWQTVWRVVVPSASPGIFAGIIIGFGRAVGETMIVLMATGNTPIMSWSPFDGMRTLSANIAVEIPEAPVGGTLYRVLFLSAVLLFVMTSTLNTAAELFRQRLRKKYGQFR